MALPSLLLVALLGATRDDKGEGRLKHVEAEVRDDLDGVVTAAISNDGKFLYASAWKGGTLVVFARDAATGKLDHKQTIADTDDPGGHHDDRPQPRRSPGRRQRLPNPKHDPVQAGDGATGELTQADIAKNGENELKPAFPIDVAFSADSRFVYVLDDNGPGDGVDGSLLTFRVKDDKLEYVATDVGMDNCYAAARGIAVHPDGKTLFIACNDANTLVVADRDKETGQTSVRPGSQGRRRRRPSIRRQAMGVVISP